MITIKCGELGTTYTTESTTKRISLVLGYRVVPNSSETYWFTAQEIEKLMADGIIADTRPAHVQNPATDRQLAYLLDLGVFVDREIDKRTASTLISAMKSGDGVGHLGFSMIDGSN